METVVAAHLRVCPSALLFNPPFTVRNTFLFLKKKQFKNKKREKKLRETTKEKMLPVGGG